MTYRTEPPKLGLTITIKPKRKSPGGARDGRSGHTGKKALVHKDGEEPVLIEGPTMAHVHRELRRRFQIHPSVHLPEKGTVQI